MAEEDRAHPTADGDGEEIAEVSVDQLRPGMYLHALPVRWAFHPFMYNRFHLDANSIEVIRGLGIQRVHVDKSRELGSTRAGVPVREGQRREKPGSRTEADGSTAGRIHRITEEARGFVKDMLAKARAGRAVDSQDVDLLSETLLHDVVTHPCTALAFGRIRSRDNYTYEHSVNVGVLLMAFGKHLGMPEPHIKRLGNAGLLHDIGKAFISDDILQKPGGLTDAEYREVKLHAQYGADLLRDTEGVSDLAVEIAGLHHERLDGTGYPNGYKADNLRIETRMSAIVDVYDALTAVRAYHSGSPPTEGLSHLMRRSGEGFDNKLVQRFIRCVGIYPPGSLVRLTSDELAIVETVRENATLFPVVQVVYDLSRKELLRNGRTVDLATSSEGICIESYEDPRHWGIPLDEFLGSRTAGTRALDRDPAGS